MLGMFLAFLAACGWGASAIFVRLGLQHLPSTVGTLLSLGVGFLLLFMLALLVNFDAIPTLSAVAFGWFALLGLVNYPMGRFFNFSSIQLAGVARAAPIVATAPLFATLWAVTLGGERPDVLTLAGGLTIVAGIALILSERRSYR